MSWKATIVLVVVIYLAIITGIAVWSSRRTRTSTDFMTARNSLGPLLVGFLMMSEFLGTGSFVGTPETAYSEGMYASMAIISLAIGFIGYGLFMAPRYKATGEYTISGVLNKKYGTGARYAASLLMIFGLMVDTVSNYTGGTIVVSGVLNINFRVASLILALLVSVALALGGLRGMGFTNIVHIVVKYSALIIVAFTAWRLLHGNVAAQHAIPHKLYTVQGTGESQLVTYTLGNVGAIFATQYLLQSVTSLRKHRQAIGAGVIAGIAIVPAGLLAAYIGVAGRGLFPKAGGAAVVPELLHKMAPLTAGLVTAGIVAAAMVSLSALLIGATTLIIKDFYVPLVKRDRQESVVVVRVVTIVLGLVPLPFVWFAPDILNVVFFSRSLRAAIGAIAVFALYLPSVGRSKTVVVALVGSLIGITVWFALGNPFGIDNVYIGLVIPVVVMLLDVLVTWLRGGLRPTAAAAPRAVAPTGEV